VGSRRILAEPTVRKNDLINFVDNRVPDSAAKIVR